MSLLTTYSDTNLNYGEGPNVTFEVQPYYYTATSSAAGQFQLPLYWQIVRRSTRSYTYVGMTKATAVTCANELRAKYTRAYAEWSANVSEGDGSSAPAVFVSQNYVIKCTADINISNTAGDAYQVDVTEDDTDTVISLTELKSDEEFANIFQLADARNSTVGVMVVTSAKWRYTSITVDYSATVANFDKNLVTVQVKSGSTWATASVSSRPTDTRLIFTSESNATFRLVYNASGATPIYSKEWTTTDPEVPTITLVESESTATTSVQYLNNLIVASTTYEIVFTSDAEQSGQMTGLKDYVLCVDGYGLTNAFNTWQQKSGALRRLDVLGSGRYKLTAICDGSPYCNGAKPSSVSLFYGRFDVTSVNTISVKPKHYIDIASATGEGLGSMASLTINFKSSENSTTVLANAKAWKTTTSSPVEISKTSLTYDTATQTYTFVGAVEVTPVYGKSTADVYMTLPMGDDPTITGMTYRVEFTPTPEPRIVANLNSVAANTTVTPNATTPITGMTFDWDWGDGNIERNLTASPSSHTYAAAGNYTITVEGGISEITGDTTAGSGYDNCWLIGAESYITEVTVSGAVKLGTRAFYNCTKMTRCVADSATAAGIGAFCLAGSETASITGSVVSLRAATSIGQLAFDGAAFESVDISSTTSFGSNALRFASAETEVTIGKTKTEVQAMTTYPFGMVAGNIIHCTDGDITI